jgi:lia operon protein LiaG
MKTKLNLKILVIGVILIMSISLGIGASRMLRDINEETSYAMGDINKIQVDMGTQNVHYIETNESKVKIHLHGKAMQELKIESEVVNKTLLVKTQRKLKIPLYEDVVLDIYIPQEYAKNLSIETSTASGGAKMDAFDLANFTFTTHSGSLNIEKLNAQKISIDTSSGSVNIKKLNANKVEIKGRSGSVSVAYDEFENQNINIETSSGSVTLGLPSTAEFLIKAKTSSGKIQCDFPINMTGNNDKKNIEGQIGTKNNKVLLQASSGSICILKK